MEKAYLLENCKRKGVFCSRISTANRFMGKNKHTHTHVYCIIVIMEKKKILGKRPNISCLIYQNLI